MISQFRDGCIRAYGDILHALGAIPGGHLWAVAGLTLLSYAVMTGYDIIALRYIQYPLPYLKISLSSCGYVPAVISIP